MSEIKIDIKTTPLSDLSPEEEKELCREARACFPQFKERYGCQFYFESFPSVVFIARINDNIAGFRNLVERTCQINDSEIRIAGISLAVHSDYRERGVASKLTEHMLDYVRNENYDIVMAFVINPIAVHILEKFGFRQVYLPIRFIDSETGGLSLIEDKTYVLELKAGAFFEKLKDIEEIHVGKGVW